MKKVLTVVVTYNGMAWIRRCLASLAASSYPTEVLVIDNGSADGTQAFVGAYFPHVELVISPVNLGFGQANNRGILRALQKGADHVFLLNQDAWVEPSTIASLVMAQQEEPQFGILSPLHYNGSGEALDEHFLTYLLQSSIRDMVGGFLSGSGGPRIIGTRFVNAAAWLISADCLRTTGLFDPIFFHYGEDENYAQRVLFHGSQLGIHTGSRISHDREDRLLKERSTVRDPWSMQAAKKEWMQVLIRATDIRRSGYRIFLFRRFVRHCLSALRAFLARRRPQTRYHGFMVKNILSYGLEIGRCRTRCFAATLPVKEEAAPIH